MVFTIDPPPRQQQHRILAPLCYGSERLHQTDVVLIGVVPRSTPKYFCALGNPKLTTNLGSNLLARFEPFQIEAIRDHGCICTGVTDVKVLVCTKLRYIHIASHPPRKPGATLNQESSESLFFAELRQRVMYAPDHRHVTRRGQARSPARVIQPREDDVSATLVDLRTQPPQGAQRRNALLHTDITRLKALGDKTLLKAPPRHQRHQRLLDSTLLELSSQVEQHDLGARSAQSINQMQNLHRQTSSPTRSNSRLHAEPLENTALDQRR